MRPCDVNTATLGEAVMAESTGGTKRPFKKISLSEKKRRKASHDLTQKKVDIKEQFSRWNDMRGGLTHSDFARVLLDCYEDNRKAIPTSQQEPPPSQVFTVQWPDKKPETVPKAVSTPMLDRGISAALGKPSYPLSDISSIGQSGDERMSGVEDLQLSKQSGPIFNIEDEVDFDDNSSEMESNTDSGDSTWDFEDLNLSLSHCIAPEEDDSDLAEMSFAEYMLGGSDSSSNSGDEDWLPKDSTEGDGSLWQPPSPTARVRKVSQYSVDESQELTESKFCLADTSCLLQLAEYRVMHCQQMRCKKDVTIQLKTVGSAVHLTWVCEDGHICSKWQSQKTIKSVNTGDFLMSVSCLLSGNNYSKLSLWSRFAQLGFVSSATHHRIQAHYTVPAVDSYWLSLQADTLKKKQDQALVLGGDGRNDSPGHSAQYCTYTLIDLTSQDIVAIIIKDKREVGLKSTNMECKALQDGLKYLLEQNLKIEELTTDAHPQIGKMMRDKYPKIKHSWDVWHGSKNLGKKLNQYALQRDKKDLRPWVEHLIRQFWWTAEHCEGSGEKFVSLLKGTIHHLLNEHEWPMGACAHGEMEGPHEKEWILPDSPAHKALQEVFFNKRFMNNIPHYVNFRHTGIIESFNQHILMYASKRFAYDYPMYKARNQLAAIDYMKHKDRKQKIRRDGKLSYKRLYNKRSSSWVRVRDMENKTYNYIKVIVEAIANLRLKDTGSQGRKKDLAQDDPRRISRTIAPVPPPTVDELITKHQSRFGDDK